MLDFELQLLYNGNNALMYSGECTSQGTSQLTSSLPPSWDACVSSHVR